MNDLKTLPGAADKATLCFIIIQALKRTCTAGNGPLANKWEQRPCNKKETR